MTVVEVYDVFADETAAWCVVRVRRGIVRVGDQITVATYPDGSRLAVGAVVGAIETGTGSASELGVGAAGRLRLTGAGLSSLRRGAMLDTTRSASQAPPAPPAVTTSPYPTYPAYASGQGPQPATSGAAPTTPQLDVDEPSRLGRVSVAFRLLLLIPQVIVLWAFSIAAEILLVLGWFAALVMGRLPGWAAEFLSDFLIYQAKVYGYLYLLTDRYPPFGFSTDPYPIRVLMPPPGRLNRLSVLFRGFLAIPAAILSGVVTFGWTVASFVIWLIVLVTGRSPQPIFLATTALLRFSLRYYAYLFLLGSTYPGGLFGDRPATTASPWAGPPSGAAPATLDQPGASAAAPSDPATYAYSAGYGTPQHGSPQAQRARPLILTSGAKALLITFIVLGTLGWIAYLAVLVANGQSSASRTAALEDLTAAHQRLAVQAQSFTNQARGCPTASSPLSCIEAADGRFAAAMDAFKADTDNIDYPADNAASAAELSSSAQQFRDLLQSLAAAPTVQAYTAVANQQSPAVSGSQFDKAYTDLVAALENQ
ncbi:MAG: DUF4389 domain-containing protein [Nocardioidaceae bacterium]